MGLDGRVVVITRSRERAGELSALLRERGAVPLEAPAIRIEPGDRPELDRAVDEAAGGAYAWIVFTSAEGVAAFLDRAAARGAAPRARIAAVGSGTARALEARGFPPDLVPDTYTTAALGEAFPPGEGRVLLPRADIAPADLEESLRAKGWDPVRVEAYRSRPERSLPEETARALAEGRVDAVVFTSRSTVEGFVGMAGGVAGAAVVCIGPVTAEAAREAGLSVTAVAEPHTLEGVVAALERLLDGAPAA